MPCVPQKKVQFIIGGYSPIPKVVLFYICPTSTGQPLGLPKLYQMGLPLPNTNATVRPCVCVLSLLVVPIFLVVMNCGDAKYIVVAGVVLIANVGQQSRVDQTISSHHGN
jgi:hypothetical protein